MLLDYRYVKAAVTSVALLFASNVLAHKIHDPTEPKFVLKKTEAGTPISPSAMNKQGFPNDEIQLQGILNKKNRTVAIISGKFYAIGDNISGYKINEINQDNVVLIGSGTQKRLYVYE